MEQFFWADMVIIVEQSNRKQFLSLRTSGEVQYVGRINI